MFEVGILNTKNTKVDTFKALQTRAQLHFA